MSMKTNTLTHGIVYAAAMLSMVAVTTGCSKYFQKGSYTASNSQAQVVNDPSLITAQSKSTVVPLAAEVMDRIETSLESSVTGVSRTAGTCGTAYTASGGNFPQSRNPGGLQASQVQAMGQLTHACCASISTTNLNTVYGIATGSSVTTNAAKLAAAGMRILGNSLGVPQTSLPSDLSAQTLATFQQQVTDLGAAGATSQQAFVSICKTALDVGFNMAK